MENISFGSKFYGTNIFANFNASFIHMQEIFGEQYLLIGDHFKIYDSYQSIEFVELHMDHMR